MPMDFVVELVKLLTVLVELAAAVMKSVSKARDGVRRRKRKDRR